AEERLDCSEINRDDVGRDFAMRLSMHPLSGSHVRRIDQAEIGAALVVEPVGHVLDPVSPLDFEVFAVRLGDAFGGHAGHVVAIHKDWHEGLLLPFARAARDIWSDVRFRGSHPGHWRAQAGIAAPNGEAAAWSAAASPLGAVDHSTTRVGLRATGRD